MLFEAMIIHLLYGTYIIFRFTSVFKDMNMNRLVVVRIEHKPISEKMNIVGIAIIVCDKVKQNN
jgi:hypothetical protein